MTRTAHYWKRPGAASAPSNILVFDTETWHGDRARVAGGEWHTLRLGCYLAYRLERGRRTRVVRGTFRNVDDFWRVVEKRLDRRRPLWIVAHNLPYDMGVTNGWVVITSSRFLCERLAVNGTLTWIKGTLDGYPVQFCDTTNYYKCPLAAVGKAVGLAKMDMPDQSAPDSVWEEYCHNDVAVTAAGWDSLVSFVRHEQLGPWQPTIAGLAFSAFRSRFMSHKVLVHNHPHVLKLERSAYYGGIVDCPRIGARIPGPVYEVDVCSMYPHVCTSPLPVRLKSWGRGLTARDLERLLRKYHVIAEVTLETADRQYPIRLKGGVYHPLGTYRTTLATPELSEAIRRGHVRRVHLAAWYLAEPVFCEYMRYFVDAKERHKRAGDESSATICKYLANSLYGKTGQCSPTWKEWNESAMIQLEVDHGLPRGSLRRYYDKPPDLYQPEETCHLTGIPEPLDVRNFWGFVEVRVGEREARDSVPAIAATVTSYARCLLRGFQTTAGNGNWFYSDTDSLWVSSPGLSRLVTTGCVEPGVLGKLAVKGEHEWLTVYGPKDYETDTIRRIKGIRAGAERTSDGGWRQLHFPTALGQIRDTRRSGVYVREVVKHLRREMKRVHVGRDGHTRPFVFPRECPEAIPND